MSPTKAEPAPSIVNRTVEKFVPVRRPNADLRTREHLVEDEVERLITAVKGNGHRDAISILIAYRHGLRVSELCDLQWNQIDFTTGVIHVRRLKGSVPFTHPLAGREMRALRKLQRDGDKSPFIFVNERKEPFSPAGFARMLQRATAKAGLGIKVHPHNLRHACGYKLANDGVDTRSLQAWLGHKNIEYTVRYSELSPTRFKDFWRD